MRRGSRGKSYRGSRFRGVSINGDKWQVFVIIKHRKYYVGQMHDEAGAARLHDKLVILHFGLKALTNFSYSVQDVKEMIGMLEDDWLI